MAKELWEGNQAFAEAAVRAGLKAFFGYPSLRRLKRWNICSVRMPELGRTFLQAESELGAINMVYGAACAGVRVMTSTSSPGTSLMMEGLSYIAGTEVPMVLVDVMRAGPGLGNIAPSQGDYNQIVHGGGHGDYHPIVLAPASIQETVDAVYDIFDIVEKYSTIGVILIDGSIGQMMEAVEMPPMREVRKDYPNWAVRGGFGKDRRVLYFSLSSILPMKKKPIFAACGAGRRSRKMKCVLKNTSWTTPKLAVMGLALPDALLFRPSGLPGLKGCLSVCCARSAYLHSLTRRSERLPNRWIISLWLK